MEILKHSQQAWSKSISGFKYNKNFSQKKKPAQELRNV